MGLVSQYIRHYIMLVLLQGIVEILLRKFWTLHSLHNALYQTVKNTVMKANNFFIFPNLIHNLILSLTDRRNSSIHSLNSDPQSPEILQSQRSITHTQLYDGRYKYIIYYIKNYMFRHFSLAILHNTCDTSYPLHLLPPHCIQHTQVEYSCLLRFFIYQPEDGQWKVPKHVVLYVINSIHICTIIQLC